MSEQPYMQLWIADFLGDTLHLSDAEIGQYMLLLMAMWRNGGYLPDDPAKLARIARNPVSEAVMALFSKCEANASVCQKRLLAELEKARGKSVVRSAAGKAGAEAKALKNKTRRQANASPLPSNCSSIAQAKVKHSPEPDSSNEESIIAETPLSILKTVLDNEHAEAVLEYRKRRKQPLSLMAARRLAKQLARYDKPNEGAEEMILRNWQGFDPSWMAPRSNAPPVAEPGKEAWRKALRQDDEKQGREVH